MVEFPLINLTKILGYKAMDNSTVFLSKATKGKLYFIAGFSSNLSFYEKDRLLSYGFIEKNTIKIIRKSIFGNTFQIQISGGSLIVRKKEANSILLRDSE